MMRSMFAGVSGLRTHQFRMDVIGNNIANVNTVGFKASRVTFQEIFSQTLRGASAPREGRGGTNLQQVGLGCALSSIDVLHTQGNLQMTQKTTDLAVQGAGFFVLSDGTRLVYTRAGNFDIDAAGYLVNASNGLRVQGWMATAGTFPVKDRNNLTDVRIPVGQAIPARATDRVAYGGNLDARAAEGDIFVTSVDVYDSLGRAHSMTVTFEKTANPNEWKWTVSGLPNLVPGTDWGTITFTTSGTFQAQTGGPVQFQADGADASSITLDFGSLTQYAASYTVAESERNGYRMGSLETFTIDSTGKVVGVYSNGLTQEIAQVALATFNNPGGLMRMGENLLAESNNSGLPQLGEAGTGGRGMIAPGALEMSNVDLAQEFTAMIVTQRGFQANSRVITTTDEMLQELVNLKR